MPVIWVLNGPNLNLLGTRQPELYGAMTLGEIEAQLCADGRARDAEVRCFQSNHEGVIVDRIQEAHGRAHGLIINPAAYTHTSLVIADALAAVDLPAIEVHLTNLFRREPERQRSRSAAACLGVICGLGGQGYRLALAALLDHLKEGKR